MINFLKRYTLNQYLSFFSIILFSISCVYSFKENFNEVSVLGDILYNMLAIAFCVVYIIKEKKKYLGDKILSFILLSMGIIGLLLMKNYRASMFWIIVSLFYVLAAFTLNNKFKSNIITILLGIISISWHSLFLVDISFSYREFLYMFFLGKEGLFLLLVFLMIYETSLEKSCTEQCQETQISTQLRELKDLLDGEYISREEFDIMKNSMINIHKI